MRFIGVEVEQGTSAPPPKKNPGSAPAPANKKEKNTIYCSDLMNLIFFVSSLTK